MANRKLDVLVLLIIAVGVAHISEQLIFGIDESYRLRNALDGWYAMFPENWAGHASMLLLTTASLMFYAMMRGGVAALLVISAFGGLGLKETYHWIVAIQSGAYEPGLVTSFAYVVIGLLIKLEVGRQIKVRVRDWWARRATRPAAA